MRFLLIEACCMLMFHASISAQCDVESCASHRHHSLQLINVSPPGGES